MCLGLDFGGLGGCIMDLGIEEYEFNGGLFLGIFGFLDVLLVCWGWRYGFINVNYYVSKKSVVESMLDIVLLMVNVF